MRNKNTVGQEVMPLFAWFKSPQKTVAYALVLLMAVTTMGCDEDDPNPLEALQEKCLEAKFLAYGNRCSFEAYVQLLNVKTGATSTFKGKEYENVILVSHLPEEIYKEAGASSHFSFSIDVARAYENCQQVNNACLSSFYVYEEPPTNVSIKTCIKNVSLSNCSDNKN